jgi:hypothetical protein
MFFPYRALDEKQYRHKLQRLRTNNEGENVNNKFTIYCTTHDIQMKHNIPYTPKQNGVAEKNDCTLKEMANFMIHYKGLSIHYWVEAINFENYIVNFTPTKALKKYNIERIVD